MNHSNIYGTNESIKCMNMRLTVYYKTLFFKNHTHITVPSHGAWMIKNKHAV